MYVWCLCRLVNSLRPRQNGHHFPDDTFKWVSLNENVSILFKISLKFLPTSPVNNVLALVQIVAWCRPGDKPLSEPMMFRLLRYICLTLHWVYSSHCCHINPTASQINSKSTENLLNMISLQPNWLCMQLLMMQWQQPWNNLFEGKYNGLPPNTGPHHFLLLLCNQLKHVV